MSNMVDFLGHQGTITKLYTAEVDIPAKSPVKFNYYTGKVSPILEYNQPFNEITSSNMINGCIIYLDSDHYMFLTAIGSQVLIVKMDTISKFPEIVYSEILITGLENYRPISGCKVSDGKVIITSFDTNIGQSVRSLAYDTSNPSVTLDSSIITVGTANPEYLDDVMTNGAIASSTEGKACIIYCQSDGSSHTGVYCTNVQLTGSSLASTGVANQIFAYSSITTDNAIIGIAECGEDKVAVSRTDEINSGSIVRVVDFSGTTPTTGSELALRTSGTTSAGDCLIMDIGRTDAFLASYLATTGNYEMAVITVSGTTCTRQTPTALTSQVNKSLFQKSWQRSVILETDVILLFEVGGGIGGIITLSGNTVDLSDIDNGSHSLGRYEFLVDVIRVGDHEVYIVDEFGHVFYTEFDANYAAPRGSGSYDIIGWSTEASIVTAGNEVRVMLKGLLKDQRQQGSDDDYVSYFFEQPGYMMNMYEVGGTANSFYYNNNTLATYRGNDLLIKGV